MERFTRRLWKKYGISIFCVALCMALLCGCAAKLTETEEEEQLICRRAAEAIESINAYGETDVQLLSGTEVDAMAQMVAMIGVQLPDRYPAAADGVRYDAMLSEDNYEVYLFDGTLVNADGIVEKTEEILDELEGYQVMISGMSIYYAEKGDTIVWALAIEKDLESDPL